MKVVLDCKIIYILLIIELTSGMPHLKIVGTKSYVPGEKRAERVGSWVF